MPKKILPLLTLLLLTLTQSTWARAGGGGHFSGGGSFGGGGGGGGFSFGGGGHSGGGFSGGGGAFGGILIPIIIFAIIIAFNIMKYHLRDSYQSYQSDTIARAAPILSRNVEASAIAAMQAADPAFDPATFYNRVSAAFLKIQNAWCAQTIASLRPFISDGIFERFSLQIDELKDLGRRDQMDDLHVSNVQLDAVDTTTHFDVATLRITASAADYEVSITTGHPVNGRVSATVFVEYWSFIRRRGAQSRTAAGLMEGHCPNCGAAIELNQSAICTYCNALLRSGEFDWVLAEITQESEYRRARAAAIPGEGDLLAIDPGFNPQHLEDKASVIFWRNLMTDRLANVDPLRKVATDDFVAQRKAAMDTSPNRRYWGECGVGSVDIHRLLIAEAQHTAIVEIHWSGSTFTIDRNGKPIRGNAGSMIRSIFVLTRKGTTRSSTDLAVSSAHCPKCGGPELIETSNACAYCHSVLNDGAYDWVLSHIYPFNSPEVDDLLSTPVGGRAAPPVIISSAAQAPAPASAKNLIAWMIKVANSDGTISPDEQRTFTQAAARRGMSRDEVDRLVRAAAAGTLETPEPANPDEAREWLTAMATSALADGVLLPIERAMLKHSANALGYSDFDLEQIIRRARTDLFNAASIHLRQNPNN